MNNNYNYTYKFFFKLCYIKGKKTDRLYPSAPVLENIDLEQ